MKNGDTKLIYYQEYGKQLRGRNIEYRKAYI